MRIPKCNKLYHYKNNEINKNIIENNNKLLTILQNFFNSDEDKESISLFKLFIIFISNNLLLNKKG